MARRNYAVIRLRPAGSGETRSLLGAVRWVRACRVSTAFPRSYRPFKKALSRSRHPACAPDDVYLSVAGIPRGIVYARYRYRELCGARRARTCTEESRRRRARHNARCRMPVPTSGATSHAQVQRTVLGRLPRRSMNTRCFSRISLNLSCEALTSCRAQLFGSARQRRGLGTSEPAQRLLGQIAEAL